MNDFTFKRLVPNPETTVLNLQILARRLDYPIYYSNYLYVYDIENNRLAEFSFNTDLDIADITNLKNLISFYKLLYQIGDELEELDEESADDSEDELSDSTK